MPTAHRKIMNDHKSRVGVATTDLSKGTQMTDIQTTEERDFSQVLADFAHGSVNTQATAKLREVVAACTETGRKGSVTLKIDISSDGKLAEVRAHITSKKPEAALPGGVFFTTEDGELRDEDPRQLKLPTKVLDVSSRAPKIVNT